MSRSDVLIQTLAGEGCFLCGSVVPRRPKVEVHSLLVIKEFPFESTGQKILCRRFCKLRKLESSSFMSKYQ
jgi:hypothetical protein